MSEGTDASAGTTPAKRRRLRIVLGVALVVVVAAATARALVRTGAKGGPRAEIVPVTVATVAQKAVPLTTRAIGNVEAFSTVAIRALAAGELVKIHFKQ